MSPLDPSGAETLMADDLAVVMVAPREPSERYTCTNIVTEAEDFLGKTIVTIESDGYQAELQVQVHIISGHASISPTCFKLKEEQ